MKKTIQYILVGAVSLSTLGLSSCNKFLDVQNRGTLTEDTQFGNINGYIDATYGVYSSMATQSLYGGILSYSFLDKLGQMFRATREGQGSTEAAIGDFDYQNTAVRTTTDALWARFYQVISYANNILRHAEDPQFADSRLARIQAEVYGLRALLHLDVYRLYGPMNYEANRTQRLLPYATTFNLENKEVYTNEAFLNRVLQDLQRAEELMGEDETIEQNATSQSDFTYNRIVHLNKYAVHALRARVYNLMGNSAQAEEYASRVIGKFQLSTPARFNDVKSFPASGEMIFGLYSPSFLQDAYSVVSAAGFFGRPDLGATLYGATTATAGNRDVRYQAYYNNTAGFGSSESNVFRRFGATAQDVSSPPVLTQGLMMIRLPEMYYVRAEARFRQGRSAEAVADLNTVRAARGLQPLDASTINTLDQLKQEILNEYKKEYPGEGQVFYAMKHLQISFPNYSGTTRQPTEELFVFPRPENEQRYGNQ